MSVFLCTVCITYSFPVHGLHYVQFSCARSALRTVFLCTVCITYSFPVHGLHYVQFSCARSALRTVFLRTVCITYSFPVHGLHYVQFSCARSALRTVFLCTVCITYSLSCSELVCSNWMYSCNKIYVLLFYSSHSNTCFVLDKPFSGRLYYTGKQVVYCHKYVFDI